MAKVKAKKNNQIRLVLSHEETTALASLLSKVDGETPEAQALSRLYDDITLAFYRKNFFELDLYSMIVESSDEGYTIKFRE